MRSWITAVSLMVVLGGIVHAQDGPPPQARKHEPWGVKDADWTADVPKWVAPKADEHPRLVFVKSDLPRLKERAKTVEGKIILQRLEKLLDGKFTLWHPAGYGLLYQLSGEVAHAEKAKQLVTEILDAKKRDAKDGRYGFTNPGSGGPMRAGPAISAVALAYDLNFDGWDEAFRRKVALAIQDNPYTSSIAARGPIGPGCNHYTAAVGGAGVGLLAIRGDSGVDASKVEDLLGKVVKQVKDDLSQGYGDRGYFFEGQQCGRISSNTGLVPFLHAYRLVAGKDLISKKDNARWLSAKWIYEFASNPDGKYTNPERGMYCRDFPRGGMWSENGDFAQGFAICPPEYVPALKWVYNHQVEPAKDKTFDVLDYPQHAVWALAHWPIDVPEKNPAEQPDLFPRVLNDAGAGYYVFRNGWSDAGKDICVSALLGTHLNGRGMATGGSVYVYGKGLGWAGQAAKYRFPGMFYTSYPIYSRFEKDGSGVISAVTYAEKLNKFTLDLAETSTKPTSLAVDFSGKCGAELLVAMVGPMVGYQVEYWMDIKPTKPSDITGQDGYATKTTEVKLGGQKAFVMTLQKGAAPAVKADGDAITVGPRKIRFDGQKLIVE